MKRRTERPWGRLAARAACLAVVAAACLPLGGCAVSLFSDHEVTDSDRIDVLEKRMERIERALPPAPAASPQR